MSNETKVRRRLDQLTQICTAFPCWYEFAEAMTNNGYVPTLRPHPGRAKGQKAWNEAVVELANRIEAIGFRVYRGM